MVEKKINRRVDPDTEVIVMNNVKGSFFYKSRDGQTVLDLDEFGDEEYVTFGELKKMLAQKRAILEKLKLLFSIVLLLHLSRLIPQLQFSMMLFLKELLKKMFK